MVDKIVDVKSMQYGCYSALVGLTQSGELVIAQPTVEILMGWTEKSYRKKVVTKSLKDFAGEGFHSAPIKISNTFHYVAATNFVPLEEFLTLMKWQVKEKNDKAIDLVIAGFADSFSDFAYKRFGLAISDKQRQAEIKARLEGIIERNEFTAEIKAYIIKHSMSANYQKQIYSNATDAVYLGIFNRRASKLKHDWNCTNPRDNMTEKELDYVKQVEELAARLIRQNDVEPVLAVIQALDRLIIPVQTR